MRFSIRSENARPAVFACSHVASIQRSHQESALWTGKCTDRMGIGKLLWLNPLILGTLLSLVPTATAGRESNAPADVEPTRESVSLNGTWKIAFDTENTGKDQRWFEHFPSTATPIRVPGVWNEIRPNYQGVAWYQTSFAAPARWQGSSVRISFGAVSYLAEIWLNGRYLGTHEGGYTPFEVEAGDALLWDKQIQPHALRDSHPIGALAHPDRALLG